MKVLAWSAVAFFVVACGETGGAVISSAVNPSNGHTYHLLGNSTWTAAEAEAVALGGHLATVRNAQEQIWLLDTFSSSRNRHLWIGLNDALVEGTFVWTSGESVTYTNWGINQPDNLHGLEDYVYIDAAHNGNWNDLQNTLQESAPGGGFIPLHGVVEIVAEPTVLGYIIPILLFGHFLWRVNRRKQAVSQLAS